MRIIVIDDHVLFRRCLVEYLKCQPEITQVAQASQPQTALQLVDELQPDVVLVDIDLGGHNGLVLARNILRSQGRSKVVILTASDSEPDMLAALEMGASGYLVKTIEPPVLCATLQRVLAGEPAFPRAFLLHQAISSVNRAAKADNEMPSMQLTERELQVLQLVTDGLMDKEIAHELSVSENTVKKHLQNLRRKLHAANRLQASLAGIRLGLVEDRDT
jgi:DNA-binding NarL/FixJ family response regulator